MHLRLIVLLAAVPVLADCQQNLSKVTQGSYDLKPGTPLLQAEWKLQVTKVKNDTIDYGLKFFPNDYSTVRRVSKINDSYYACVPGKSGILVLGKNDSVRFVDKYSSSLKNMKEVFRIVQQGKDVWMSGPDALYRCNADTMKYEITGRDDWWYPDIYAGRNCIWVVSKSDLYMVRDEAAVRIRTPEKVLAWYAGDDSMIGFTETGKFTVSEKKGIAYAALAMPPEVISVLKSRGRPSDWADVIHDGALFLMEPGNNKIYRIANDAVHTANFNHAELMGISKNGELWTVGYNSDSKDYMIQVSGKDWVRQLVKNGEVLSTAKAIIPGYNEVYGQGFLRNDVPTVISASKGIYTLRNDKLDTIHGRNFSRELSVLALDKSAPGTYITNIKNNHWAPLLKSKAKVIGPGIQINVFTNNRDADANSWICDNGKLVKQNDRSVMIEEYNIEEELKKHGQPSYETFKNRSMMIGQRVVVNNKGIIHVMGRHSLVAFDPASKTWRSMLVTPTDDRTEIDHRIVFEDSEGYVWFADDDAAVYYFNGKEVKKFMEGKGIQFWEIGEDRQLTMVKGDHLILMDLARIGGSGNYPVLATYRVDPWMHKLGAMSTVVWHENRPIVINSYGFYFYNKPIAD